MANQWNNFFSLSQHLQFFNNTIVDVPNLSAKASSKRKNPPKPPVSKTAKPKTTKQPKKPVDSNPTTSRTTATVNHTPKRKREQPSHMVWKFFVEGEDRHSAVCKICGKKLVDMSSRTSSMIGHLRSVHKLDPQLHRLVSPAWNHFTKIVDQEVAVCDICGLKTDIKQRNTTPMLYHLKSKHGIVSQRKVGKQSNNDDKDTKSVEDSCADTSGTLTLPSEQNKENTEAVVDQESENDTKPGQDSFDDTFDTLTLLKEKNNEKAESFVDQEFEKDIKPARSSCDDTSGTLTLPSEQNKENTEAVVDQESDNGTKPAQDSFDDTLGTLTLLTVKTESFVDQESENDTKPVRGSCGPTSDISPMVAYYKQLATTSGDRQLSEDKENMP